MLHNLNLKRIEINKLLGYKKFAMPSIWSCDSYVKVVQMLSTPGNKQIMYINDEL